AVLYGNAKKCDEANCAGNIDGHAAHPESKQPTEKSDGNDGENESGVANGAERRIKQDENQGDDGRNDVGESPLCALLIFELAAPSEFVFGGIKFHLVCDFLAGFGEKAGEVATAQVEANREVAAVHLAGDAALAGSGINLCDLGKRDASAGGK